MSNKLLVVIAGPTGVGKTEVAVQLAQHYHTEILSADSRQVYKELDIGVGRPPRQMLSKVRHHFIGHISIHQPYTAAMYAREALFVLEGLFKQHDIAILAGGTGLYIKALTEGLDEIPEVPPNIFDKWQKQWQVQGIDSLLSSLKTLDPEYYDRVDQANHTRLIRALSVTEATGSPFSSFLKGKKVKLPFKVLNIALDLPREQLYERIDARVQQMIEDGWREEAKGLYPHRHLQALQTVGYKELFAHFDGERTLEETISDIQQVTRRYAKRQMTWWRNQGEWTSYHPAEIKDIKKEIDQAMQAIRPHRQE